MLSLEGGAAGLVRAQLEDRAGFSGPGEQGAADVGYLHLVRLAVRRRDARRAEELHHERAFAGAVVALQLARAEEHAHAEPTAIVEGGGQVLPPVRAALCGRVLTGLVDPAAQEAPYPLLEGLGRRWPG